MDPSLCKRKSPPLGLLSSASKRSKVGDDFSSSSSSRSRIYEESSALARVMFYEKGQWKDFFPETLLALMAAFQARCTVVEFTLRGNRYVVSFIRMCQINLATGFCRSISWIDDTGRRFIPSRCIEGHLRTFMHTDSIAAACSTDHFPHYADGVSNNTGQQEAVSNLKGAPVAKERVSESTSDVVRCEHDKLDRRSSALSSTESYSIDSEASSSYSSETSSTVSSSDSESEVTSSSSHAYVGRSFSQVPPEFPLLQDKLLALNPTEAEFDEVKKKFLAGLSPLAKHTTITGISRNLHCSISAKVQYQAFSQQKSALEALRGDANVRYAWYGTSKQGISSLVLHGFGQPRTLMDRPMYGVGVYLAPEKFPYKGLVYSDVDEDGQQHMVLCRVIMGTMEQVPRGSTQFHPSNEKYDSGVDNIENPKHYVVWSTHMNTHILMDYVISFKLAAPFQGFVANSKEKLALDCFVDNRFQQRPQGKVQSGKASGKVSNLSRSPWMSIDMLFLLLKASLSADNMNILQQQHLALKVSKICAFSE
ncbi:hypothetical protein KP509_35G050900 [Ceratopteris richardii]|uniref:Poly [ADP-ribose] polymerase n=1 Tax=Ceratopteris richardii TaxID=49495 RepID=A0A8T2QI32_CERRI|nr:hypothetical protein KP509_35G050900 [Ceratopteris richardii]